MKTDEILKQFEFYRSGPPELRRELEQQGSLARLDAGQMFINHGDQCSCYALLGAGRLRVFATNENGREITFYYVTPGVTCLLSAACLMSGAPIPASARAEEPVVALLYTGDVFRRWLDTYPTVRAHVMQQIANHTAEMMSLVTDVAFLRMDRRLASWLHTRFADANHAERPALQVTHEKIAGELGTAREVVSRLLKEFERQGILSLSRSHVTLVDSDRLRQMTNQG